MGGSAKGKGAGPGRGKGKDAGRGSKGVSAKGASGGVPERSDHTLHFYSIDEVLSGLQKAVRRGHSRNAAFWAGELHVSGLSPIATKRLLIMAVEDIGIASPYAPFVAAAAQSMILAMPDDAEATQSQSGEEWVPPETLPGRLALVCGLALWLSSLPKTRTSCMLSVFQRAKAEERERGLAAGGLLPCGADDVGAALARLYALCVGDLATFLARTSLADVDAEFLALEEAVLMQAYAFQLCQKTEALALAPVFDALCEAMLAEDRRLQAEARSSALPAELAGAAGDLVAGFAAVRKMVSDLQHMSTGALDSAARMVLNQALLLATRAHRLVLEGLIVVPSMLDIAAQPDLTPVDFAPACAACGRNRVDGRALARYNAMRLSRYARARVGQGRASNAPVAPSPEAFVRAEVLGACPALVPRVVFECLLRPADDPMARLLRLPKYCVDVHTRRGSGYPMYREWETRIAPLHPRLLEWDPEEVRKTHGELDAQGRQMASQFSRYGLVVSDEYFPGPAEPTFGMELRPADWQTFEAVDLPVASLDHGEAFIDRRSFPDGYGPAWKSEASDLDSGVGGITSYSSSCPGPAAGGGAGNLSEGLARALRGRGREGRCACSGRSPYVDPAMPHDPFFVAAKTFMFWAGERSFPSAGDFPGGQLPKLLQSTAFSTIHDDPSNGKRLTQTEHLLEMTEGPSVGAGDEKRSAIDSRPSQVTELHRVRMHELMRQLRDRGPVGTPAPAEATAAPARPRDAAGHPPPGKPPPPASSAPVAAAADDVVAGGGAPDGAAEGASSAAAPRKSRWGRK